MTSAPEYPTRPARKSDSVLEQCFAVHSRSLPRQGRSESDRALRFVYRRTSRTACCKSRRSGTRLCARARLNSSSRFATCPSAAPMICAASIPAFRAPLSATVATGTPDGICRMERTESHPSIEFEERIGTPITGREVTDATIPGRCAAPPAPAIMTFSPRRLASSAYWIIRCGVR